MRISQDRCKTDMRTGGGLMPLGTDQNNTFDTITMDVLE